MNKRMQYLITVSRLVLGAVFIFSGFVKCIDPLGSVYKLVDYFNAFGTAWAGSFASIFGILLAIAEFLIGFALFLNIRMRLAILGLVIFMGIFTPLTLYLAIANPVHDCGCFGDALIITNWQTFWKNIILLVPTVFLYLKRNEAKEKIGVLEQWGLAIFGVVFSLLVIQNAYKHLPVMDFRPYSVGTYIPDGMIIPEGAPQDEFEYSFIYEKEGKQQHFDLNNLPDTTWTYIDREVTLIAKGYEPPIHDFSIFTLDGLDITDNVLEGENYTFLLVMYDLSKTDVEYLEKINRVAGYLQSKGYGFYALTASTTEEMDKFVEKHNPTYEFYNTDEITLKTIVRANPGLVLLKEGVIIDKWHANDIPEVDKFHAMLTHQALAKYKGQQEKNTVWMILLIVAFVVSLYYHLRRYWTK